MALDLSADGAALIAVLLAADRLDVDQLGRPQRVIRLGVAKVDLAADELLCITDAEGRFTVPDASLADTG